MTSQSMRLPLTIDITKTETVETDALIDSGSAGIFIHREYAKQLGLKQIPLARPIIAQNINGTANKQGDMTQIPSKSPRCRARKRIFCSWTPMVAKSQS